MKRREFTRLAAQAGAVASLAPFVSAGQAQAAMPPEGSYVKLSQPLPQSASGKIEVVEFFWYGCPHCKSFEPYLEAWAAKLPADVDLKRAPVVFRENPFVLHQKIYFTLEAMGLVASHHRKVFSTFAPRRNELDSEKLIREFVTANGIDAGKFFDLFNSIKVDTKCRQARNLAEGYKIDAVPTLGVAGRYYTSVGQAGSPERALAVVDALIAVSRKAG